MTSTPTKRGLMGLPTVMVFMSAAILFLIHVSPAEAATFAVNTADDVDDGSCNASHCSLREAINAANRLSDLDAITFNIPGLAPHTIRPGRSYPVNNFPVIIDGTTQPGYAGPPIVELDGTLTGAESNGLQLRGGSSTVRGLVINRFKRNGITLLARGSYLIEDNYIGTDVTGTVARGNGEHGISIGREFITNTQNTIVRNLISGNVGHGIIIGHPDAGANVIQGNLIGTNVAGTAALGNTLDGVFILAPNNTVGGTAAGARNVISGNRRHGISMWGQGNANGNLVQGNLIGTGADGMSALGNGSEGVRIVDSASNTIGGTAAASANIIAFNGGDGVLVGQSSNDSRWSRNGILSNSIFSNAGLGIDLILDGVTPNDPGDPDPGPNEHQNFPVLTAISGSTVEGTLNSKPNTSYRLEFFANAEGDPSGHGEGERFLGSTIVTTDGNGHVSFSFASPTPISGGEFITSTASDFANNTSEFSRWLRAPAGPPPPPPPPPTNRAPSCTASASPNRLWPPNHKYILVSIGGVTDPDGDTVTITIIGVTQDEPINGPGDGDTAPDAKATSAANQVYVRAERSALEDGRVYRIAYRARDSKGGECTGVATVGVPHDMGRESTPIDSAPPSYNSFGS